VAKYELALTAHETPFVVQLYAARLVKFGEMVAALVVANAY
jgi:hypothetical protein